MTELANWVSGAPTPMPTNYNAVGGYGFNAYDPRRDPRIFADGRPVLATGGSSSGVGTAANLWAANVGTETSGSILSPSNQNMLVGIKPTVGRVSRYGVIPITADQDTPGPMAKSVTDAAIMLGALEGAAPDPNDPATTRCQAPPRHDYTRSLRVNALRARASASARQLPLTVGLHGVAPGLNPEQMRAMADAIAVLQRHGAVIVDPAAFKRGRPGSGQQLPCGARAPGRPGQGHDAECSTVFKCGMKRLPERGWPHRAAAPVKSLTAWAWIRRTERGRAEVRTVERTFPTRWTSRPTARYERDQRGCASRGRPRHRR